MKSIKMSIGGKKKKLIVASGLDLLGAEIEGETVAVDRITCMQGASIVSSETAASGSNSVPELVIPLVEKNKKITLEEEAELRVMSKLSGQLSTENSNTDADNLSVEVKNKTKVGGKNAPMLIANMNPGLLGDLNDDERFKIDISNRASDISADSNAYDSIPVEKFGAALLRGMGWGGPSEKDKNQAKAYDKVLMAREARLGLGAQVKPPDKGTKGSKEKKEKEKKDWANKAISKMGSQSLEDGSLVWLRNSTYAGRRACVKNVTGVPGLDQIRLIMESDDSLIEVKRTDVVLLTKSELKEKPYVGLQMVRSSQNDDKADDIDRDHNGDSKKNQKRKQDSDSSHNSKKHKVDQEREKKKELMWLREGITVRVVSKKQGNAYLQKGEVVDVYGGDGSASVKLLSSGNLVDNIKQKHLETVLPPTGGECLVLMGQYKGQAGRLLEKRKTDETCVLELSESLEVVVVGMEEIASYARM